ncbi:hypothetical protein [Pseudorhodoplanes sp.]|uniref:hypothetical protein n=1 Tax=Pseudorhodoplanes sp. TaxID=1934341 RepID=UPI003918C804
MRLFLASIGTAAVIATSGAATSPAQARFDMTVKAPVHVETVACRTVRTRIVGPGGQVTFRTRRVCAPAAAPRRCRMERQRIVRPNGTVVFRTVQRCR